MKPQQVAQAGLKLIMLLPPLKVLGLQTCATTQAESLLKQINHARTSAMDSVMYSNTRKIGKGANYNRFKMALTVMAD